MDKTKTTTLRDFVRDTLSAAQFDKLEERMAMTPTALTRMFNRVETKTSIDQVKELAKILGCTPKYLVQEFGMGRQVISIAEAEGIGFVVS